MTHCTGFVFSSFTAGVPRDSVSGPIRLRMKSFGRDGAIVAAAREELM